MIKYKKQLGIIVVWFLFSLVLFGCSDPNNLPPPVTNPAEIGSTHTLPPTIRPTAEELSAPTFQPSITPLDKPKEIPLDEIVVDPRSALLAAYLADLESNGRFMGSVLVAQKDQILINEGYGYADVNSNTPNTPQTQFLIGSLTKQFTAAAILRLQETGLLNVNDPISKYLPEYPNGNQITIQHLLTNSAGIWNYEERPDIRQVVGKPVALDELIASFANQPLLFPPGQQFSYSSSGYILLTKIIENVSGTSYAEFLQSEIINQAGMSSSGYDYFAPGLTSLATGYRLTPGGPQPEILIDPSWPSGAGALYSTVEDLYRWESAFSAGDLLSPQSQASMVTPRVDTGEGGAYGYGLQIGQLVGRPSIFHGGAIFGYASFMLEFPEEDALVIILSNGTQLPPRQIALDLAQILFANGSG